MSAPVRLAVALLGGALASTLAAQAPRTPRGPAMTVAYFSQLQELPAFTPEEMAKRRDDLDDDADAVAADTALNNWKVCVTGALQRWAALRPGPGTLVDGAFGRCADVQRDYRTQLMRLRQDGRIVIDMNMARSMTRTLEEIWRPRLIAAALDQDLAATGVVPPK